MEVENLFYDGESITLDSYLKAYGIKNANRYLDPPTTVLDSCWLYDNIKECVQELQYAINTNSRICIVGDSDTDGICSAYLMYKTLKLHNKKLNIKIVLPNGKERGIEPSYVRDEIKEYKTDLVIIPDGGTNSKEFEDDLNGARLLIIDHHEPNNNLCEHALIVNNVMNKNECNTELSGTGVTFKVCQALDLTIGTKYSNRFIDLVGFTIISDSMDIRTYENRWFVNYLLANKENVHNKFIRALFDKYLDDEYTQRDIAFKIVPKINSVIRCGTKEDRQKLYLAMMGKDIEETIKLCEECHAKQIKTVTKFIEKHSKDIENFKNNNVVVIDSTDIQKTFSGLIAGKISSMTNKLAIVGRNVNGILKGSYRGQIPSNELTVIPQVLEVVGHLHACGISLDSNDIDGFVKEIDKLDINIKRQVTFSFSYNKVTNGIFSEFDGYDWLWGHELDKPTFYIKNIELNKDNVTIMKDKHLKVTTDKFNVLLFNCESRFKEFGIIKDENGEYKFDDHDYTLNIIGSPSINVYKGKKTNQFIVDEFEVSRLTNTFDDLM